MYSGIHHKIYLKEIRLDCSNTKRKQLLFVPYPGIRFHIIEIPDM